jgi:hypothetical protein
LYQRSGQRSEAAIIRASLIKYDLISKDHFNNLRAFQILSEQATFPEHVYGSNSRLSTEDHHVAEERINRVIDTNKTKKNWVWTFLEFQDIEKTPKRQVDRVMQKLPGAILHRAEREVMPTVQTRAVLCEIFHNPSTLT